MPAQLVWSPQGPWQVSGAADALRPPYCAPGIEGCRPRGAQAASAERSSRDKTLLT